MSVGHMISPLLENDWGPFLVNQSQDPNQISKNKSSFILLDLVLSVKAIARLMYSHFSKHSLAWTETCLNRIQSVKQT
jgi:hypothetical protein